MEQLRTKVLLALLALAVAFGSASVAQAQVTYQVTTTPTFVINTGRAEVLGSIRITATSPTATPTIASTIQYLFQGVGCDNTNTSGMGILADGTQFIVGTNVAFSASSPVVNTTAGCVVSIVVNGAVAVTQNVSFIELRGVRARVDFLGGITNIGQNINGALSATPSNSSLFTVPNQGVVGITAVGLEFVSTTTGTVLQCIGVGTQPALTYREGFNGAFVQHVITAALTGVPANARPVFGGTANTQVRIVVTGIPTGVTLTWPAFVNSTGLTTPAFVASTSGSRMERVTTSTATSQTYEYACGDQSQCDITQEVFPYTAANANTGSGGLGTAAIALAASATAGFGTATLQIRLFPDLITTDATSITSTPLNAAVKPRFNDPLRPTPPANIAISAPCRTSLLWPYVPSRYPQGSTSTGAAQPGSFDTGLVVADTGFDNPAFLQGSTDFGANGPPAGSCRWYAFQQLSTHDPATGASGSGTVTSPTAVTRGPIKAGDTDVLLATAIVGTNAWQGYMITVCDFQFAHGFAFAFENALTAGQLPVNAQGYIPLIIPDPVLRGGRVANDPSCIGAAGVKIANVAAAAFPIASTNVACAQAGEGLVQ